MLYETFICFYVNEAKPPCFSVCSQMFDDVENTTIKMFLKQMSNYLFAISFQLMFYKTLRYCLARAFQHYLPFTFMYMLCISDRSQCLGPLLTSVRLAAMHVTVNEVSSLLCEILTLIIIKTYLQTEWRRYCITRRPVA